MKEIRRDASGWPVRIAAEFSAEGRWQDLSLPDRARQQLEIAPDAVGLVEGDVRLTFGQVDAAARRLAGGLIASGLRRGEVVSFQLPNWHEAAILNLAIAYAGLVANPIVPIYRDAEVGFILRDARSRMYVAPQRFRNVDYGAMADRLLLDCPDLRDVVLVRSQAGSHTSWEDLIKRGEGQGQGPFDRLDPDAVKLVMYTSGTTAAAKGVLHTHNTIDTAVRVFRDRFSLTGRDAVFMPSPVTHITGYLFALELMWVAGIKAVLTDRWEPAKAIAAIDREGVTFSVGTTPFLTELLDAAGSQGSRLPSLRFYMCGGAAVPPDLIHRARAALPHASVFRVYGATETPNAALGLAEGSDGERAANTDGQITNYDVRLVDPATGVAVGPEEEGEIALFGPQMMVGYTRPDDTAAAFAADGFVRSGDLGKLDAHGFLTITGRSKDLINRGGEKFSPKEIEDILHMHPAVAEVAVVAMPHERLGETGCAFVVTRAGMTIDLAEVLRFLDDHAIARQKFPEHLELVGELPLTASGKVRKNVLREAISRQRTISGLLDQA